MPTITTTVYHITGDPCQQYKGRKIKGINIVKKEIKLSFSADCNYLEYKGLI